jgi:prephenate dehydrogenase
MGSTKLEIVQAMNTLPEVFDPLGGHPICGKETSGLAHADGDLFRAAAFIFTALEQTSSQARSFANTLAAALHAHPSS